MSWFNKDVPSKLCRARCCSCKKKMERINCLLKQIPKFDRNPEEKLCNRCRYSNNMCSKCLLIGKMALINKIHDDCKIQMLYEKWASEVKKLQDAVNGCMGICEAGLRETESSETLTDIQHVASRDINIEPIQYEQFGNLGEVNASLMKGKLTNTDIRDSGNRNLNKNQSKFEGKKRMSIQNDKMVNKKGQLDKGKLEKGKEKGKEKEKGGKTKEHKPKKSKQTTRKKVIDEKQRMKIFLEKIKNKHKKDVGESIELDNSDKIQMTDPKKIEKPIPILPKSMIKRCKEVKYEPLLPLESKQENHYKYKFQTDEEDISKESSLYQEDDSAKISEYSRTVRKSEATKKKFASGGLSYALSNRNFIKKGWTILPVMQTERVVKIFRMVPELSGNHWFHKMANETMFHDTGTILARIDETGIGRFYYQSGAVAFTKSPENLCFLYTNDDESKQTFLAYFDEIGNGIIYDKKGQIRMQYNQLDGLIVDKNLRPPNQWKWHYMSGPVKYRTVISEKHLNLDLKKFEIHDALREQPDRNSLEQEMSMIELTADNKLDSSDQLTSAEMRMIAFKISDNFSIHIMDQRHVFIIFTDGKANIRANVGMRLLNEIVCIQSISHRPGTKVILPEGRDHGLDG